MCHEQKGFVFWGSQDDYLRFLFTRAIDVSYQTNNIETTRLFICNYIYFYILDKLVTRITNDIFEMVC